MAQSSIWWLLAGAAVAIELVTGSFYLLLLGIGLAAAAVAAHLGASDVVQVLVAAIVGGGSVLVWRSVRLRHPPSLQASANRDVNLDIGETVHVHGWHADGTGTVNYRGAKWAVALAQGANSVSPAPPVPGAHRIVEIVGSRLMLEKI